MGVFKYSQLDFLLNGLGFTFLLVDIGLDIRTVVDFYEEKAYVSLGFLLLFLLGSSLLVNAFSWLWYSYDHFRRETKVEKCLSRRQLDALHILQLGIYFRHAGLIETSVRRFCAKKAEEKNFHEGNAVYLSHDVSMLRLMEAFSESAPQLILMITITLQRGQFDTLKVLMAFSSACNIAVGMTTYHRSLRSFLPNKEKQKMVSSVVYFVWNFFLISSRITALALFASLFPCFIVSHFLCSWVIFFFFLWRSKSKFMDSPCGEWLYRATVGLIWYFDWFNVVDGKTRNRTLCYHTYIFIDISFLCGLWCWWTMISTKPSYFKTSPSIPIFIAVSVATIYLVGLFLKMIYYKFCHPNFAKEQLKGDPGTESTTIEASNEDDIDGATFHVEKKNPLDGKFDNLSPFPVTTNVTYCSLPRTPATNIKNFNKRMRKLAETFFSGPA